ncbi:Serine/threonine protein kinase [Agreia bicolorata]|uniref:non-specific serine/threonine protein kinase n=1 Tax=Agreia bicolorata TaxID=110935 RepID=A0A1T4Y4X2_9MICO|nr:serine/threonine-protein kinase [Agreia bicolorata]SKA96693.1 Serine/threonine protein kinase [Agreia bicolorata]
MNARRPPSPPPEIAGFTHEQLLGSGGFADVFLYEQRMPRRRVAIKVLLSEALTAGARENFDAEANLMAQLSTHPSIVTIYQADIAADGRPYLVMEYCSRPNLAARYRREKISVAEALRIGIQVAGAVETAHRAGILHRDIKPANILTTEYNRPALTDFGISVTMVGGGDDEAVGMSIPWSPPEVFGQNSSSGPGGDIYALGATVYTLLAGRSPFEVVGGSNSGLDLITRIQQSPLSRTGRADVPDSLEQILATSMAKREEDRFGSALEFARALQKVQLELSLSVTPADVLDDSLPSAAEEEEDDGNTRIRGIVTIDPTAPVAGTANRRPVPSATPASTMPPVPPVGIPPVTFNQPNRAPVPDAVEATQRRGQIPAAPYVPASAPAAFGLTAPPIEQTQHRTPQPTQHTEASQSSRSKKVPILVGAISLVVLLAVGGTIFAINAAGGSPAAVKTEDPVDPIDVIPGGTVAPPVDVVGAPGEGGIVFTWSNPEPEAGDVYQWGLLVPGTEPTLASTTDATVTVVPTEGQKTCIEVSVRRKDGRASEPTTGCAP